MNDTILVEITEQLTPVSLNIEETPTNVTVDVVDNTQNVVISTESTNEIVNIDTELVQNNVNIDITSIPSNVTVDIVNIVNEVTINIEQPIIVQEEQPESFTLSRDNNNNIVAINYTSKPTVTITRDEDGSILSFSDTIYLNTINRANSIITGITVTEL